VQLRPGRAEVVVTVLHVAEVAQGKQPGLLALALSILRLFGTQQADVFLQRTLEHRVAVEAGIEQKLPGLGAVEPLQGSASAACSLVECTCASSTTRASLTSTAAW
jgi:hypothetical protein